MSDLDRPTIDRVHAAGFVLVPRDRHRLGHQAGSTSSQPHGDFTEHRVGCSCGEAFIATNADAAWAAFRAHVIERTGMAPYVQGGHDVDELAELAWWRQFASKVVNDEELPAVGSPLGGWGWRVERVDPS